MKVIGIEGASDAELAGVMAGDDLREVDGHPVADGIDVAHAIGWADEDEIDFVFERDGDRLAVRLPSVHPDELGLELEPDTLRTCGNRCVFCFIDQLPGGLRHSLYIKDEDYRLSFTCGNYVTLTNLSEPDYERIIAQRLSPLYVSVHATDEGIRRRLLGNPDAPPVLPSLKRLVESGISLHTQIVVCPGINDGPVLEGTIRDLASLGGGLSSVAVVPVGLTAHRGGLSELTPVTSTHARDIITTVERWQTTMLAARHEPVVYAADEIYLIAGLDLPPRAEYGDFPQLENGVGLLRWFEHDLLSEAARLRGIDARGVRITILTGTLAAPFIDRAVRTAFDGVERLEVRVVPVANRLLGESVTVAGLLAGGDIADAVRRAEAADLFVLPGEAFNGDGLTLDGRTVADIRAASGIEHIEASDDLVTTIEQRLRTDVRTEGS